MTQEWKEPAAGDDVQMPLGDMLAQPFADVHKAAFTSGPAKVTLLGKATMELRVAQNASTEQRLRLLQGWYRQRLRERLEPLLQRWQKALGGELVACGIKRMKTKWGSCNHRARNIRLNTELVKKPKDLLEYVVVHEMLHLIAPTHSERFVALLSEHYPAWREARAELNELPLGAAAWRM